MNQKTAKLLKKFASATSGNPRQERIRWLSLNRHQRATERRRIREKVEE